MMTLESIALNKISQIQKGNGCVPFPYVEPCGAGSMKAEGTICLVGTNNKNVKSNWIKNTGYWSSFPSPASCPPPLHLSQTALTCGFLLDTGLPPWLPGFVLFLECIFPLTFAHTSYTDVRWCSSDSQAFRMTALKHFNIPFLLITVYNRVPHLSLGPLSKGASLNIYFFLFLFS